MAKDYSKHRDRMNLWAVRAMLKNAGASPLIDGLFPYPLLYGITGAARSGKDTVAAFMVHKLDRPCTFVALATPIKKILKELFEFTDEQLNGGHKGAFDTRYPRAGGYLTPRYAMQKLGTEFGRDCYPDLWVDLCMKEIFRNANAGETSIVTDVRFDNEADMIHGLGGKLIRVIRPNGPSIEGQHSSEAGVSREVDVTIVNDGSMEELEERVHLGMNALWEHL